MKILRAILVGACLWGLVFTTFIFISFIPNLNASILQQSIIISLLIVPYGLITTKLYYKTGDKTHGIVVGFVMLVTALLLDACITVPFIEIPYNNRGHLEFFTDPLLWFIVTESMLIIYFYWKLKVKASRVLVQ